MLEIEDRGMEIDKTSNMAVLQKASEILQSLGRNDIALEIRDVLEKDESDTKNSYQVCFYNIKADGNIYNQPEFKTDDL